MTLTFSVFTVSAARCCRTRWRSAWWILLHLLLHLLSCRCTFSGLRAKFKLQTNSSDSSKTNTWERNESGWALVIVVRRATLGEAELCYQQDERERVPLSLVPLDLTLSQLSRGPFIRLQICIIYELPSESAFSLQGVLLYFITFRIEAFVCAAW